MEEEHSGPNILEVMMRLVGAVTATIAAVRAAQGAMRAWQRVVAAVRGEEKSEAEKKDGAAEEEAAA
jgi:hypothetical protein